MSYLLILVVVLVAVSPLLTMMPSRRQRQLANLRQAAASAGLYVQFQRDLPGEREAVLYGCRRQRGDRPTALGTYVREGSGWRAKDGLWPEDRLALLADLPGGVSEIREEMGGVIALWDEHGEAEEVQAIARVLRGLLGRSY
jgi:hypothetical protein